jgi:hypothetical protein
VPIRKACRADASGGDGEFKSWINGLLATPWHWSNGGVLDGPVFYEVNESRHASANTGSPRELNSCAKAVVSYYERKLSGQTNQSH